MKYRYVAKDLTGKDVKGVVEGRSPEAVALVLADQKLVPVKIAPMQSVLGGDSFLTIGGGVSGAEMANFTRQLSTMLTAGLPLTDALTLLANQSSPKLTKITRLILNDVQAGLALSTAMAKHPMVFSKVYVALVKAGESAGVMETVLNRLAESLEKTREFVIKVKGAMIYPAIIVIGMVIVMAIMMIVVVPKMKLLYEDFGAELPWETKVIIGISNFATGYWWATAIILGGAFYGLRFYLSTTTGRYQWDTLIYRLPITGPLAKYVMLTELSRTMGLLIGSGVSVVEALNIVADTIGNMPVEKEINHVAKQVEKGFPISISFSNSEIFPPIFGQMIAVGEETGKLDEVLGKLAHYFEAESEQRVKGLTTAIEPVILMILAVGVGFLMFAVIMPIYTITDKI